MRAAFILGMMLYCFSALAQTTTNTTDSASLAKPFISAWIPDSSKGTVVNGQGRFYLHTKPGNYKVVFRAPGFMPMAKQVSPNDNSLASFVLPSIDGITASRARADTIIRQVIAGRRRYRKDILPYTGYLYSKAEQQLDDAPRVFVKNDIARQLNLNNNRRGIISLSESISRFHTRSTDYIKEQVDGAKLTSSTEAFNFNSAAELHIDLYKDYVILAGLSDHAFLSPIAYSAMAHYRYNLTGQFYDGDKLVYRIAVHPKHRDEHLFSGNIYVIDRDWLLYAADISLAKTGHIDFIDSVNIKQQFIPADSGNWVPQLTDLNFYGKLLGFKYGGYFLQVYRDLALDTVAYRSSYKEVFHGNKEVYQRGDDFWEKERPTPLTIAEAHFYAATVAAQRHKKDLTVTDSLQNGNNRFRFFDYVVNGYTLHHYANKSSWSFPAPYNLFFYNTVEGFGIDLKIRHTQVYDNQRTLTITPDARYGFSDHLYNTNVFVNFVYNPYHQASVYGKIGSDFLDLNNAGTISPFINSLSTLLLGNNYIKLYQSRFLMGGTDGEVANGVLLNGQIEYAERRPLFNTTQTFNRDSINLTSNNPLDPYGNMQLFPPYHALTFSGSATITFDQQYKITPSGKFIMPNPYPRLRLNYRQGLPVLGSNVNYNFVSVDVFQDHLTTGLFGYMSYFVSAGTFPNTHNLYYPDYHQFSGGQSFFFNASLGTFHFLNFYTYSTYKTYVEAHLEHNFAGYFLSRVPLLSKLNLEEIAGASYLTQGTLPNYKEVYIGLKRTVVRLDYGLAFGKFTNRIQGFRLSYNL